MSRTKGGDTKSYIYADPSTSSEHASSSAISDCLRLKNFRLRSDRLDRVGVNNFRPRVGGARGNALSEADFIPAILA